MIGAEGFFTNGEAALVERLGVGIAALAVVKRGQVVERRGDIGVVGAEGFFADGEAALRQGDGLSVLSFALEFGDLGIERAEIISLLCHGKRREQEPQRHRDHRNMPRQTRHILPSNFDKPSMPSGGASHKQVQVYCR